MGKQIIALVLLGLLWAIPGGAAEKAGAAKANVGALGRIQPQNGIAHLMGTQGDRIAQILVKEGDVVEKNAPLVVFESHTTSSLELALAELAAREADELGAKAVALQQLRLKEAEDGGAKAVAMQRQKVDAAQAEHAFAERRKSRFEGIDGQSLSAQQMDERESQAKVTKAKLAAAKAELERAILSHETGADQARQELERLRLNREIATARAKRQLELAKEKLARATLRAPDKGTVLEIGQVVGDTVGARPLVRMADLDQIVVMAEVFEGDLLNIAPGMKATITASALPAPINAEVVAVGRLITGASRAANVKVRLADPKTAARLINMEVNVSIALGPP